MGALRDLLASGLVHRSSAAPRRLPGRWGYDELAGRFVEVTGRAASARLTAAARLVLEAQLRGEPAAWITMPDATFFPPDVASHGVDLAALAVVRLDTPLAMLRAADCLLRSAAFGLVVVDFGASADIADPVQVRLANLARQHDAALVCLAASFAAEVRRASPSSRESSMERMDGAPAASGARAPSHRSGAHGSFASLRAESVRRRTAVGRFECALDVQKDKRRGRPWRAEQVFDGPVGLR